MALCIIFFIWACRRGVRFTSHSHTHFQMPPRRRAFHYNDFGLEPTTIPPPTIGDGGISDWQWHPFSPKSFPFQSLTQARRTPLPFRGEQRTTSSHGSPVPRFFPRTVPLPGVAALVPRALTPGYRALAPNGAAQGKCLFFSPQSP